MRYTVGLLRQVWAGLIVLLALTVVLGIGYPAAVWAVSRIGADSAEGAPITDATGCVVGSRLIGLDPKPAAGQPDPYFHARVLGSAADEDPFATGDPSASAASNLGPNNETLADFIEQRRAAIAEREGVDPAAVPPDAVTGSGSGLDPDISPEYAALQIPRVARVTGIPEQRVREAVDEHTEGRQLGFLGAERVNVLQLNISLGRTCGHNGAPQAPRGG